MQKLNKNRYFKNASVEFDTTTLSPTYKLIIGIPGLSNAIAVSSMLGLDNELVDKAKDLLNNHRDLILQEEMPVYQIPIYQMLQVANIRLNHDENALYYARKGVELCDGINADNNAQLNGMIRDSKRMFQEYINQNAQKVPEKAKKKGFFSRLFSR